MSASSAASVPDHRDDRWLWALFIVAWLINFGYSLVGWENTLISEFEFRQAQTAITTEYFPPGHFPLAYETPVFGPPWTIPLEFPVYEAVVANFVAVTGLPLDPSGRLVSWLFFQLSLPAFYVLLGSLGVRRVAARLLCLALLLTSPLYIFYSRAFLIESAALCFCAWFLAGFARWLATSRPSWLVVAVVAGALGATVKVTTMVVFGTAAVLFATWVGWERRQRNLRSDVRKLAWSTLGVFALPMIAGLAWIAFSSAIRSRSVGADILNGAAGYWSFGDVAQRLSPGYWSRTLGAWTRNVASEAGLILGAYLFIRQRGPSRAVVAGLFLAFFSGQLIFSNLYFVHDYYFYASGVFLLLGIGILLAEQSEDLTLPRWGRVALPVVVIITQLLNYSRVYFPYQQHNHPSTDLIQAIRDLTKPEDVIVVIGFDWDATVPYYAHRRAVMFPTGSEAKFANVSQSIARVGAENIGAVVIGGNHRADFGYVARTMPGLDLGPSPMLVDQRDEIGLWIPRTRQSEARDRLPVRPYASLEVILERPGEGAPRVLNLREIGRRKEFDILSPRPFKASASGDFSMTAIGDEVMLNAHATTEMRFHVPRGASRIKAEFGIDDRAFTGKEHTDGVEFVVAQARSNQPERILFHRLLDPFNRAEDQGKQRLNVALDSLPEGDLILRTLPGPQNNASFDWSYWGKIEIR
ncbi:MAG: hypothetical protein JWM35_806 [Verrucomicrobia bacterium]|nr:hypothetical protein [Verrucomicrobiota bacterium]